jgi:hypothetical protein
MRVIISLKPEVLRSRKELRYYVYADDKTFTVSVFLVKNHKLIDNVLWASLEAKFVKLNFDFFEDFLLKDAMSIEELEQAFKEATSSVEAFENALREFPSYDFLVKEIYGLDFDGVNVYLLKNRRVKASSIREKRMKLDEVEKELQLPLNDMDIPALYIVSKFGEYKVPFDITRDERGEPLNKFVLINEEDAKKLVEDALERNLNWREYPSPKFIREGLKEDLEPTPYYEYYVFYLSPHFRDLVYKNGGK